MVIIEVLSSFVVRPLPRWIFSYKPCNVLFNSVDALQTSHFEGLTDFKVNENQVQNAIEYILIGTETFSH